MQSSPIGWTGGKRRLRAEILKRIPTHAVYCEVFAGAAWVLFGKPSGTSRVEVLNDIHSDLTNFWRCVRERHLELIEHLTFRLASQADFHRESDSGQSEVARSAAFFWRLKLAFGSRNVNPSFGYSLLQRGPGFVSDRIRDALIAAHDRLKNVYIFTERYEKLLARFDSDQTFFYCDPPYYDAGSCYEHDFSHDDHERLSARLKALHGHFLLSYNDCEEIRRLYSWAEIEELTTRYSLSRTATARKVARAELLIRNYKLPGERT